MAGMNRRHLLCGLRGGRRHARGRTTRARAQNKPEKLVYIGENQGGWKRALVEEVGPAFEKATGHQGGVHHSSRSMPGGRG